MHIVFAHQSEIRLVLNAYRDNFCRCWLLFVLFLDTHSTSFSPIRAKEDSYLTHAATIFVDVGFFLYYSSILIVRYFLTYSVRMAARVSSRKAQSEIRLVDRPRCRHKEMMVSLGVLFLGVLSLGVFSLGVLSLGVVWVVSLGVLLWV